ncbi:MAG TPA: SMC family ATPase, partial [Actinomycetota bacterium]|nr:SMC family ATPase [Actinomycetota bacterium]
MRPLRLRVKGFTAFRDEVELDLSGLDLFAITGPTGSGKSSLLDAMTYALYGRADRVGRQVGQLISQGQAGMAVELEFAVGDRRYRVARRTSRTGPSRAVLERWEGDRWVAEAASGVRGVDARIEGIVGLDYEAFTRSVLLPQGRFQEFLVGDAAERRRILTELLGLELFERLGKRAGELRRDAEVEVRTKRNVLETEYAGASEEAVARGEEELRQAEARAERLRAARERVRDVLERWRAIAAEADALGSLAEEARGTAALVRRREEELRGIAARLAEARGDAEAAAARVREARKEAARAERDLRDAE